jgi:hypothetical protein
MPQKDANNRPLGTRRSEIQVQSTNLHEPLGVDSILEARVAHGKHLHGEELLRASNGHDTDFGQRDRLGTCDDLGFWTRAGEEEVDHDVARAGKPRGGKPLHTSCSTTATAR